jgi:uncharacterized protein YbjT (DUF2867 family)
MVLVVGATGMVGSAICQKLVQRGEKVAALVRPTSSEERVEALRSFGVELRTGDLKDPQSLAAVCRGVDAVISTASSTLSRQPGDSIESVDAAGQLNLVDAAKAANAGRFLFLSFRRLAAPSFPLDDAKQRVEQAIKSLNFTIIQASFFMEVWLSPALGFDYANASARIYGAGTNPISWVSFRDVAEMCVLGLRHRAAERRVIEFGGPEALSPLEVVARFEKISGKSFRLEHVPEPALLSQVQNATDSLQKSFAGIMLGYSRGDAMDMASVVETFRIKLTSLNDYAQSVLASAAAT